MQVFITQQDIDECISWRIGWSNPCPVTMVLRRRFPGKYVLVNGMHILAGEEYKVSKELGKFIVDWDRKRKVTPIAFRMRLVKGWKHKLNRWWQKHIVPVYQKYPPMKYVWKYFNDRAIACMIKEATEKMQKQHGPVH